MAAQAILDRLMSESSTQKVTDAAGACLLARDPATAAEQVGWPR
jgi:hypothetical protein